MIKVVKHFSYHQHFVPRGLFALTPGLYTYMKANSLHTSSSLKPLDQYLPHGGRGEGGREAGEGGGNLEFSRTKTALTLNLCI